MYYGKRIRSLLLGLCASAAFGAILVYNCVQASSEPVVPEKLISLPYAIKGTQLVVQGVTGYEGAYMEDGSNEEVVDVAALILKNNGAMVREAEITIYAADQQFTFYATMIPAHSELLVLEKDKKIWQTHRVVSVEGWASDEPTTDVSLRIIEEGLGTLKLTNTTNEMLDQLTVYHKGWSEETGMYLGGITYETLVDRIAPGETLYLCPRFYASGSSRVIKITKK